MGIPGLLPFLSNSTRDAHISEFENEFVAIDAYCWLHKGVYSCAFELATKKPTVKYVNYCLRYIEMLLHFKVKPILVFDGRHLSSKSETEKKRREDRKKKYEKGKELMRAGKVSEGKKLLGESVDVTHEMALNLMKQCREKNIDCLVAPYEADAQLAFLSLRNIVKCIVTEDSDLLAYGSKRVMFKMDTSGRGKLIERSEIHFSLNMTPEEFTEDLFRYLCILIGCDYLPSLHLIGPVNALKFIKMLKDKDIYDALPKLPSYINKKNVEVTSEYINGFKIADKTFKHQLVYDPLKRTQVPLRPVKNEDDIVGSKLPDDMAFNLAVGNIDPMTMRIVDHYDPDKTGRGFTLIWKTDSLSNCTPRQTPSLPEARKRYREVLESNPVQSVTNDLKKQRTPFNTISIKNSVASERKIPDSGFDFEPKIPVEKSNSDESRLLKSRYFSRVKDKSKEKQIVSESDRRKDESYDDYLQRLYNEYFPQGENENGEPEKNENGGRSSKFCSLCQNGHSRCVCAKETVDVSDSRKLRNGEVLKENKSQHFLLDEISKTESEKSKENEEVREKKKTEEKIFEKVSPSQTLSFDFSKILSKLSDSPSAETDTQNYKTDVAVKENSEIISVEEEEKEESVRSPSPVFKLSKEKNKNYRLLGNTAGTPTSIYFSSFTSDPKNLQGSSRRTPLTSQRKLSSVKSFGSAPSKAGKNNLKSSTVNRTLFQFGFKKQSREESVSGE